jgi:transposase
MVMSDSITPSSTPPLPTTLAECHAVIIEQSTVITQLREIIAQQQATIDEQQAVLQSMKRDMALMKRALFGQRRERFDDPRQRLLFDAVVVGEASQDDVSGEDDLAASNETDNDDANVEEDGDEAQSSTQRTGRRRRVIPESLPRVRRIHELDESEIPEHLQSDTGRRFLKKIGEYIEWEPPRLTVIEEFIEMLAIDNDDATQTTMLAADRPPRIINAFAGPSLLAGLAVNHFADHLPYYRLEEILGRSQLTIDRSTQCRWMIRLSKALSPLTDLMRFLTLQSDVVQADETPVKMLAPGQGKTSTTYLWSVLGGRISQRDVGSGVPVERGWRLMAGGGSSLFRLCCVLA